MGLETDEPVAEVVAPTNNGASPPFRDLVITLLEPLARRTHQRIGGSMADRARKYDIIERYIKRWRKETGPDLYPVFRLILPEKDKDRAMYGVKEAVLGRILIKVLRISPQSEDAQALRNWKRPGQSRYAGDFPSRAYELLEKRPIRMEWSTYTIDDINGFLDQISEVPKEEKQQPVLEGLYENMCPIELKWMIQIVLKQMKIGVSERTVFSAFHPDAAKLYNVCSSLRRVCWELWDVNHRLNDEQKDIHLFQCCLPQLANFRKVNIESTIKRLHAIPFWVEEKLDGERIQLHMANGRFRYFSRRAKDYTYLYGESFDDENGALSKYLRNAFDKGVREVILDGEMITWDPVEEARVPFGSLKTAALGERDNPWSETSMRPCYVVFDILLLNGQPLAHYALRDRRKAIERILKPIEKRMEIIPYQEMTTVHEVENKLLQVVEEASEGLVLKNPNSMYKVNERNDTWVKVKPEYMNEYGENLDLLVIGGYYGNGHRRGGKLASFMCGLRIDDPHGSPQQKFYSFCRVGGGYSAADYAKIMHATEGHWHRDNWTEASKYYEYPESGKNMPDSWIEPSKSIVIQVKAAQSVATILFKAGITLRFPRFQQVRDDKNWESCLSLSDFHNLRQEVESMIKESKMTVGRKPARKRVKMKRYVLGANDLYHREIDEPRASPELSGALHGLRLYVATDAPDAQKSKQELEQMIRQGGGTLCHDIEKNPDTMIVASRETVLVNAFLKKHKHKSVVKPNWLLACIESKELLPIQPDDYLFLSRDKKMNLMKTFDPYGDCYATDSSIASLGRTFTSKRLDDANMTLEDPDKFIRSLAHWPEFEGFPYFSLLSCVAYILDFSDDIARCIITAMHGTVVNSMQTKELTHVIVNTAHDARSARQEIADMINRHMIPRMVRREWLLECWKNKAFVDDEPFTV